MKAKERLVGALLLSALLLFIVGGLSRFVPDEWVWAVVPRFAEVLAPWVLAAGFLSALLGAVLGARWLGSGLSICCVLAAGSLLTEHLRLSEPLAKGSADVRVLFFNVLYSNTANADAIARMVIRENPDIVIFAESRGVAPAFPLLKAHFAYADLCNGEMCQPAVFSNLKVLKSGTLLAGGGGGEPLFTGTFQTAKGPFTIMAVHLMKSWFSGYAAYERSGLISKAVQQKDASFMIGDFNLPTWASPLHQILSRTGFRAMRLPIPSWPAQAGNFGVPIDHALVRGNTHIVAVKPVGQDLGSNHRGLLVTLHIDG